jgi:hypothetical protein
MIKDDWYMMEDQIERKTFAIDVLEKKIMSNKEEYERELTGYKKETELIIEGKNAMIKKLEESKEELQTALEMNRLKCEK